MCSGGDEGSVAVLSELELATAKTMLERGDEPGDVAYWFGLSEDELRDALSEYESSELKTLPNEDLPPPGPYPSVNSAYAALGAVQKALDLLNTARVVAGLPRKNFVLPRIERPARSTRPRKRERLNETKLPQHRPVTPKPRPPKQPPLEPRRYEGLARRPPGPGNSDRHGPRVIAADSLGRERALPIELRLRFARGGSCSIALIGSRSPDLPDDLTVAASYGPLDLRAMQDEWYQDVVPEDIAQILREGTVWGQEGGPVRWSLGGRELYVLGERTDLSGWISQPRLRLGRRHAVLCTEQLRPAAEEALRAAGVAPAPAIDAVFGAPPGWVVIPNVVPTRPISPSGEADILNALRPLPEVEISLEGGIRLEYTTWLEGSPPLVRVYGDSAHRGEVRIDGVPAFCGEDGGYRVPGWDSVGTHNVWSAGTNKFYSIVSFDASWEGWEAYTFPIAVGSSRRLSICGPLVREASTDQNDWAATIQLPETNTVVLGAAPGESVLAIRVSGIRGVPFVASPSFRPVWALPPDPLHCNKANARIILVGEEAEPAVHATVAQAKRSSHIEAWCRLILDASRKGLAIEPDTERVGALWLRYKRAARRIWRSRK